MSLNFVETIIRRLVDMVIHVGWARDDIAARKVVLSIMAVAAIVAMILPWVFRDGHNNPSVPKAKIDEALKITLPKNGI